MTDADLIRMANQIAAAFAPYGADQAAAETAKHLQTFWDPRMRTRLAALRAAPDLAPAAAAAAELLARH